MKENTPTLLVTGFEPFAEQSINPSSQIIDALGKMNFTNIKVKTCLLPVVRYKALEKAKAAIAEFQPDVVIALGQAAGRDAISPEKVAINLDDYPIADNEGNQPIDEAVVTDGENAYFSTLPTKAIVQAITAKGIPAKLSYSAGTYVCNHLMYGLLHHLKATPVRCGFIHVPLSDEQVAQMPDSLAAKPFMKLDDMVSAIAEAINVSTELKTDIRQVSGRSC